MSIPETLATEPHAPDRTLTGVRRAAIVFVIVSLALAALLGIVTLLTGEFGEVESKILLTTLLTAAFAITSLCHLAVVGRALRVVGFVGIAASALALGLGLALIWVSWDTWNGTWDVILKSFVVLAIASASLAQANLLLLLAARRQRIIRTGLIVTLAAVALLATLVSLSILTNGEIPGNDGDFYWRFVGVVAIVDVLGTIVLPVLGRVFRAGTTAVTVRLEGDAAAAVLELAAARGVTPAEAIAAVVTSPPATD
ncbi:membrane-associated HD superfamily phosphohydrolase [Leifsonia sp. AK011]|uniref:hypothetical protein n=1 Tax=Leifsonia sp. AK011 TaxID=2723075 RepID=UPI0015C87D0C|nr:hypothetical protein [Leifsonia sp. AK011]NYF11060.1 membrane-associated HD superfamily phosphohydrolase [Leifsonia sp. AK011]